jgi:hypothetical protein
MARSACTKKVVAEWTKSTSTEATIKKLIDAGVIPYATLGGWRTSHGEIYPNPNLGELVVFEDFFLHGFGVPCHPFLRKLLNYYRISLCNLHPNSVLSIAIFINLCEGYLGIYPHFNLFHHFFCLKKKGGSCRSKIAKGVYLNLCDGMKS